MTLKEYINTEPAPNAAAAIANICTAFMHKLIPDYVISNKDVLAFVGALSNYLEMEYPKEAAEAADYTAEMWRRFS